METFAGRVFVHGGGIVASFAADRKSYFKIVLPREKKEFKTPPSQAEGSRLFQEGNRFLRKMLRGTVAGRLDPAHIPRFAVCDQLIDGDALRTHYA